MREGFVAVVAARLLLVAVYLYLGFAAVWAMHILGKWIRQRKTRHRVDPEWVGGRAFRCDHDCFLAQVCVAGEALHAMLGRRKRFLTAQRLLSNQTFRDIYRAEALDVDQRLRITSLSFLFTDLKGSTELYERVGDLAAYDLVRAHFGVLHEIVAACAGAVVKTIGDAVMATFPTPGRALEAALRMREAMRGFNAGRHREDLLVKIGVHEGPCLAVTLNERLDYFGQTVNIAARVQGLAQSRAICATEPVVGDAEAAKLLAQAKLVPVAQRRALRGISGELTVYEIP